MIFKLYRKENAPDYCMGRLYVSVADADDDANLRSDDDFYLCDTLEPAVDDDSDDRRTPTAIRAGTYDLALTRSPRFGRLLPILVDVPGRCGIRIHRGNVPSDTKGCIMPGHYIGRGRLVGSTVREQDIVKMMMESATPSVITVIDDFDTPAQQTIEDEGNPYATTNPLSQLVSDEIWRKLRLLAA